MNVADQIVSFLFSFRDLRNKAYHGSTKGRYVKKKRGGQSQCSTNKYQQQKAKEPLFLVYHLPENVQYTAKRIVQIYKKRM